MPKLQHAHARDESDPKTMAGKVQPGKIYAIVAARHGYGSEGRRYEVGPFVEGVTRFQYLDQTLENMHNECPEVH